MRLRGRTAPLVTRALPFVTLLTFFLTACPSDAPAPRPGPSSSVPGASATPRDAEIRVAYPWEPSTLNPFVRGGDAPAVRELTRPLLPALFRSLPGGEPEPWLVERILSESGTEVRLKLRSDARWSDGRPIVAGDVAFTWRTIMDQRLPIASRAGYDALSDVAAPDATTVVFRFKQPFAGWRDLFSAGLGVLPQHALQGRDFAAALRSEWPVSGGPFVLARYTRGLEMLLEASPHAWPAPPLVRRIRIQFVPDPVTALQLYRAGRVDVLGPYSSPDLSRRLAREPRTSVTSDLGATWVGLLLRSDTGVLADARVRKALALAAGVPGIVEGLVRSEGEPMGAPFAQPTGDTTTPPAADPAAAAALLDQAGFTARRGEVRRKGSSELSLTMASVSGDDLVARVVRALYQRLRSAGFDISLVGLEYEQLWRDWLPSSRLHTAVVRFADPPAGALWARYAGNQAYPAGTNYARIADATLDGALGSAPDAARRLSEIVPVVPLYRVRVAVAVRTTVTGVRAAASADGFLVSAAEWRLAA